MPPALQGPEPTARILYRCGPATWSGAVCCEALQGTSRAPHEVGPTTRPLILVDERPGQSVFPCAHPKGFEPLTF